MKGINIITANFSNGGRQCITRKLFQYDYGQKVQIKGLNLPQSFEVHISNTNNPLSSSNIFLGKNNEIEIPDEYLTSGEDIYIWIFLHQTASDGETRYTINIPIQKRPKAESKDFTPVDKNVVDQLITTLEEKIDNMESATEQAKEVFLKYPKIVNDYWHFYDVNTKQWMNSEVKALGQDGVGIENVVFNNDYSLTFYFTDESTFTTPPIKGEKGQKGDTGVTPKFTIDTIETLPAGSYASVSIQGTPENPMLHFKIPRGYTGEKGETGAMPNISIGTVNNLPPDSHPYVTQTGTAENPILTFGLVRGEKGDSGEQGPQGEKGQKGDKGDPGEPGTNMEIHICSITEYDVETRMPTIINPNDKTFYLVPTEDGASPDLFTEWIYVNGAWEMFGSAKIDLSRYLTDVTVNGNSVVTNGVAEISIEDAADYERLQNLPSIEGVTLIGDKTFPQLNMSKLTNSEIEALLQ